MCSYHCVESMLFHEYFIENFYYGDMEMLALLNTKPNRYFWVALITFFFITRERVSICFTQNENVIFICEQRNYQQSSEMREIFWLKMRFSAHETYRPIMISKRKSNALSNSLWQKKNIFPGNEQKKRNAAHTNCHYTDIGVDVLLAHRHWCALH